MAKAPLISIIVPVYKVEHELPRCIESILNQTYTDFELLLIDDGSPDRSGDICDEYAIKDKKIRVIHKTNGGLSETRNMGIREAKGKYILFVDSDDCIDLDSCERFSKYLSYNVDIVIGLLRDEYGNLYSKLSSAKVGVKYTGIDYYRNFSNSIIPCSVASLYRRDYLIENGLFFLEGHYHEDNDFTPRAYIQAKTVIYTGSVFYTRFIREDSITQHHDKRKNLLDILSISIRLEQYSSSIKDKKVQRLLRETLCNSYLFMFREADIFQYNVTNINKYINKKLVIKNGYTLRNRLKACLFCVSPRFYIYISKIV